MSRVWTTLKFPIGANGVWYPLCRACDGVIMIPLDPSLLAPGVPYLEGTILTGPVCIDNELVYTVDYEDSLLADPGSTLLQCNYRICCNDCSPKMVKLLTDLQNARIVDVEELVAGLVIPDPNQSVMYGPDELLNDTVNNDGVTVYADPLNTYLPDHESVAFNFVNPSTVRSMRVAFKGKFGVSVINAHLTRYQHLFSEVYLKVDGVEQVNTLDQDIQVIIPGASNRTVAVIVSHVITVPPSGSVLLQVGGRVRRVAGADPTDLLSLRIDSQYAALQQIIGVTV